MKSLFCVALIAIFMTVACLQLTYTEITNTVIAAYDFEIIQQDNKGFYVPNIGSKRIHGYLYNNAELSQQWKRSKVLSLTRKDYLYATTQRRFPTDFSMVASVKIPPQEHSIFFSLKMGDGKNLRSTREIQILPTGNIRFWGVFLPPPGIIGAAMFELQSENENVTDNQWHHIVYTYHSEIHKIFVDGEIVYQEELRPTFVAGEFIHIFLKGARIGITGEALFDDIGFFSTHLSIEEVQHLYNHGITRFLEEMPVSPQGKVATTWGDIRGSAYD